MLLNLTGIVAVRLFFASCIYLLSVASAAADCAAEVDALFDGPLDPFQRAPFRAERQIFAADGTVQFVWDDVTETPMRVITSMRGSGQATLIIDRDYWTGPTAEGPWSKPDGLLPENRRQQIEAGVAARRDGVSNPVCDGLVEVEGRMLERYSFRVDTAPESAGMGTGDSNVIYIEPESGHWVRWDISEIVTPWQPEPTGETEIDRYTYDPSIAITAPRS